MGTTIVPSTSISPRGALEACVPWEQWMCQQVLLRRTLPGHELRHASCTRMSFMSKLLRGIAAGWGAKKLGGGCFSTILIFLLLWWLLGSFDVFR
jgi:hypothetical protein